MVAVGTSPRREDTPGCTLRWLHTVNWLGMVVTVAAASGNAREGTKMVRANIDEVVGLVHICVIGDVEDRITRAMQEQHVSREVATERQAREDRMRPRASRRLMPWETTGIGRYHLIVDSSRMILDEAVEEIAAAVGAEREMLDLDLPPEDQA